MDKFQTLLPRFLALILDSLLLLPIGIIDDWIRNSGFSREILLALITILSLAHISYFIIMHTLSGQTVGKMLMKIKVLDVSESPLKFRQAFLRDLPQIVTVFGLLFFVNTSLLDETVVGSPEYLANPFVILIMLWGVADIVVFFTNVKRRALHDFIAGSVVVRIKEAYENSPAAEN